MVSQQEKSFLNQTLELSFKCRCGYLLNPFNDLIVLKTEPTPSGCNFQGHYSGSLISPQYLHPHLSSCVSLPPPPHNTLVYLESFKPLSVLSSLLTWPSLVLLLSHGMLHLPLPFLRTRTRSLFSFIGIAHFLLNLHPTLQVHFIHTWWGCWRVGHCRGHCYNL